MADELSNRRLVATRAGEKCPAVVAIPHDRDVLVTLVRRGLVDPDATHLAEVLETPRRVDETLRKPPQTIIAYAESIRHLLDWSVDAHRQHELLQPKGQTAPATRLRNFRDARGSAMTATYARNHRRDEKTMTPKAKILPVPLWRFDSGW